MSVCERVIVSVCMVLVAVSFCLVCEHFRTHCARYFECIKQNE